MTHTQQTNEVPAAEQVVAAATGLVTAGPIGALVGWGTIKALKGKWIPWIVAGIPAVVTINTVNLVGLSIISSFVPTTPNISNPIVELPRPDRPDRPTTLPHFNDPLPGGSGTLRDKCGVLIEAYDSHDLVGIFDTTYDISNQHDIPDGMTAPQACNAVGM